MRQAAILVSSLCVASCAAAGPEPLSFGALVPLTGPLADSGPRITQALELVGERVNAAGGVAGRPVRVVVRDTGSDSEKGRLAGVALAADASVLALVGPQEDDVARALVPTFVERGMPAISGGTTSATFTTIEDGDWFFRTSPSAQALGTALAARMSADGVHRAAVLFTGTETGRSFSGVMANAFTGEIVAPGFDYQGPVRLDAGQATYREVLAAIAAKNVEAVVLALDPATGAAVARDWQLLAGHGKLYFAPSLRGDAFLQASPRGALEGGVGVSRARPAGEGGFAAAYESRFFGEKPGFESDATADAFALVLLAAEAAAHEAGGAVTRQGLRDQLRKVADPPGESVGFDDLPRALALVRAGTDIDYRGASGPVDFDAVGDVAADVELWTVRDGAIVPLEAR